MITANETAQHDVKIKKGIYLMTDVFGNQKITKITPAEKSIKIELLEPAPKTKICKSYESLYKKGSIRLLFGDLSPVYCWNSMEFKVYLQNGLEPLYFAFQKSA